MNAEFTRPLDESVLTGILLTKHFRFLTRNIDSVIRNDPNAITVQLQSRNRLAYHHGSQCILTVHLDMQHNKPLIKCSADRNFKDHRLNSICSTQYRHLMRHWVGTDSDRFRECFEAYLQAVVKAVEPRYYKGDSQDNKAEGYWLNLTYRQFGNEWSKQKPWLIVDREFSLGFPHASEKKAYYAEHSKPYYEIKRRLQEENREKWGKPSKRAPKQEVGLLAIDNEGQLVAVELRRGSNTAGICWAPMDAAMHRDAIANALPSISGSITKLITQKASLGILPQTALTRIPENGFTKVSAAVAIANPQPEDHPCWALLEESIKQIHSNCPNLKIETAKLSFE